MLSAAGQRGRIALSAHSRGGDGGWRGQGVTVDAAGGIRYTALASMLKSCGLTIKDVKPLPLPGDNAPQAVIAGQAKEAVQHLNELIDVQQQLGAGKVTVVMKMSQTNPDTMYEMHGVLKSNLAKKRTAFVDMVAVQITALKWMADPPISTRWRSSAPSPATRRA